MRLWDLETGAELHRLTDHSNYVTSLAISNDPLLSISGDGDGYLLLWDLQNFTTKLKVKAHTSAIWAVAFSPDSQTAFTAGSDQIIREWDLSNGESISP